MVSKAHLQITEKLTVSLLLFLFFFFTESNRKRVKEAGVISTVSPCLKSQNKELVRFLCGFYLNSSMNYGKIMSSLFSRMLITKNNSTYSNRIK